ncbi:hypothetical protein ACFE04_015175 [Oxalis oulophora]
MVKFSKELEAQLIPEWKDAFVNYWQLKKCVKKIKISRTPKIVPSHDYGQSIFDSVRFFARKFSDKLNFHVDHKTEIIQVKKKSMADGSSDDDDEVYETELVQLFSEEDEMKVFFERLDYELNKVNQFYKTQESELLERGETLNKQLNILLDIKKILSEQRRKPNPGSLPQSRSLSTRNSDFSDDSQTNDVIAALEKNGVNFINSATRNKTKNGKPKMTLRIDIPATTPTRTITAVASMLWEDLVNNTKNEDYNYINKKKIQYAQKKIRGAFVDLYKGLGHLKTYSSLNMTAFTKIMKKFDKVANQEASASYLKAVKRSHFISSDKVVSLMDEVESIFTTHFANNDRKKAMQYLKPQQQKESHIVTFGAGLLTGCFVSLLVVYAMLVHFTGTLSSHNAAAYLNIAYPVFSAFTLLSLHLFMYACNLYMWRNTRINYNFIFEFSSKTALKYQDAIFMSTTFMASLFAALVVHLMLRASGFSPSHVDVIPGTIVLVFVVILICPFDFFYRSTRYCFLRVMRNIVCSPFYKVLMVDFFMADQLTSQIPMLRHLESTACYFLAEYFKTHQYATCRTGTLYRELVYVISFLPYYWRAMQCARRWFDESDPNHLANFGKYVSAMVAAGARLTYARNPDSPLWFSIVLITSVFATVYQLYWDFVKDWGLLNPNSKNPWLRDNLILKNRSIYYMSIGLNVVLRVAWVETVMKFHNTMIKSDFLDILLASLEVIRRGHWNFYRLEHEHLNNVGKFRAVKTVPLPFRETYSDG